MNRWHWIGIAIGVVLIAMALTACSQAQAHSWYTGYQNRHKESCCGGSDCAQLPDDAVKPVKGGYVVSYLPPGFPNARQITLPVTIANEDAQPGEDPVHYHMCIWSSAVKCFFVPAPGF